MLIYPQPTKEKPLIIDSYPYGFKRTKALYYIETTNKGQRIVFRTLNPKTQNWNKEKKGIYSDVIIIYKNDNNGHIENEVLSFAYNGQEELNIFLNKYETILSDYQKEKIKVFKAIIETRKHIKITIEGDNLTDEEREQQKIKQNEINKDIKSIFEYYLKKELCLKEK